MKQPEHAATLDIMFALHVANITRRSLLSDPPHRPWPHLSLVRKHYIIGIICTGSCIN